jgi:hypothetical protein
MEYTLPMATLVPGMAKENSKMTYMFFLKETP